MATTLQNQCTVIFFRKKVTFSNIPVDLPDLSWELSEEGLAQSSAGHRGRNMEVRSGQGVVSSAPGNMAGNWREGGQYPRGFETIRDLLPFVSWASENTER